MPVRQRVLPVFLFVLFCFAARVDALPGACCDGQGGCSVLEPEDCEASGGFYQGHSTECDPGDTCRACCKDGGCTDRIRSKCWQGVTMAPGSSCDPSPCWGGCCDGQGGCSHLSMPECEAAGGFYQGTSSSAVCPLPAGPAAPASSTRTARTPSRRCVRVSSGGSAPTAIPTTACPTGGACCMPRGSCSLLTEPECLDQGGNYQGDETRCSSCGACCSNGDCEMTLNWTCEGLFHGSSSDCDPSPCLEEGACCDDNGGCQELTLPDCLALGHDFQGTGTVCDVGQTCGACCDGRCTVTIPALCQGQHLGPGTDCFPWPCVGACCATDASCTHTLKSECNGAFLGNEACGGISQNECGACCTGPGCSQCVLGTDPMCTGIYMGDGIDCDPDPCPKPAGACCDGQGGCSVLHPAECTAQGGTYQGHDSACDVGDTCGACCECGECRDSVEDLCFAEFHGATSSCESAPCSFPPCDPAAIQPVRLLRIVKLTPGSDLRLTWQPDPGAHGYNVWVVTDKRNLPAARSGGPVWPVGGCTHLPTLAHADACQATPVCFYNVLGVCDGIEAPE